MHPRNHQLGHRSIRILLQTDPILHTAHPHHHSRDDNKATTSSVHATVRHSLTTDKSRHHFRPHDRRKHQHKSPVHPVPRLLQRRRKPNLPPPILSNLPTPPYRPRHPLNPPFPPPPHPQPKKLDNERRRPHLHHPAPQPPPPRVQTTHRPPPRRAVERRAISPAL